MSHAMRASKSEARPAVTPRAGAKHSPVGLRVGKPDDAFEQEADRAADAVVGRGNAGLDWSLSAMSIDAPPRRGQADAAASTGEIIRRQATGHAPTGNAPPIVQAALSAPGRPLEASTRNFFEPRFGHDFSRVRVRTDSLAAESAQSIHANAYTVGQDIAFAPGRYAPHNPEGRRLLAHELAHVVQQSRGGSAPEIDPRAEHEKDADRAAHAVATEAPNIAVEGATRVGIAREVDTEAARTAQRRLGKAWSELGRLDKKAKDGAAAIKEEDTTRAYDAVNSALRYAHQSNDKELVAEANKLKDRFVALTANTPAGRAAAAPSHPAASTAEMTNDDAHRVVAAQRGFDAGTSPAKIATLQAQLANATDQKEADKINAKIDVEKRRIPVSTPTLKDPEVLAAKREMLQEQLKTEKKPAARRKLEEQTRALDEQQKAVQTAAISPEHTSLLALQGGSLGHSSQTNVTIQIIGPDKKVIATVQGRNVSSHDQHAEDVAMARLEALPDKKRFRDAKMVIWGDQEVCERCAPRAAQFAERHGLDEAVGVTTQAPALTSRGNLSGANALAKTTTMKLADPDAVHKLEQAQTPADNAKPAAPVALKHASMPLYKRANPGNPSASAADAETTVHPEEHKKPEPTKPIAAPAAPPAAKQPRPPSLAKTGTGPVSPTPPAKAPASPKPAASQPSPKPQAPKAPSKLPNVPAKAQTAAKPTPPATKPAAASVPATPRPAAKQARSPTNIAPPIKPAATKPAAASVPATPHPATKQTKSPTTAAPPSPAPHHDEHEAGSAPTKERSHYVQHGGSVIAGPDKLGAAGSLGAGATQSHGHGLQTTQSVEFGGQVVTSVEEVAGATPPQYRVSLTIDLSAGGSVGASREGGLGGSLSGSASGSLKMSVTHVMTGDAKDKYLNAVKTGQGGASEELRVAQMVAKGSIDEAKAYLGHRKSLGGSAAAAKQMAEGDEVTLSAGGKLEANAGVSGSKSGGGSSLGVGVGFSTSGELTRSQARKDGKILITVAATSSKGMSVGGSVSEGVAGMGLTHEDARSKGKSVTLALDPNAPDFDALYAEVMAASTVDDLDKLAVRRANLAGSTTTSRGTSSADTTSASVGFLSVTGKDAHSYNEEEIRDAGGVSHRYEGSTSSGASLAVAGRDVAASTTTDQFAATVGPDNEATGETSSTTSESDYLGSIKKLGASYDKKPVGTTAGVVTGGTKVLQEKSEIQGKKLTNDSFSRLAELAKDPGAWQKSWHGTVDTFVDWEATRKKVLAANGDRNLISKAMAQFESQGSGRSQTVENAVSETGIAFDFPEELIDQKPVFDQLVAADLFAHPRELAGAGRPQDAIAELNADNDKLGKLLTGVQMHQDSVKNPAALGEMMRRISGKRTAIRAEIRKLSPKPAAAPVGDAKSGAGQDKAAAVDPAAQAAQQEALAKRQERNAKIDDLIPSLLTNRDKERAGFAAVNEEFKKEESWFSKPDSAVIADKLNQLKPLYDQWEKSLAELRAVYTERGDSPDRANQFAPNRAEWNALYNKAFH